MSLGRRIGWIQWQNEISCSTLRSDFATRRCLGHPETRRPRARVDNRTKHSIGNVECSCAPSVVERLKGCSNTQTIGNELRRWRTEEATANLRTPAILCLGGCCSAFATGKNPKKDSRELDSFLGAFKTAVRQYGQDPVDEPRDIGKEYPRDITLGDQDIDDTRGPICRNSGLINLKPYKTGETLEISIENALIVVSRGIDLRRCTWLRSS